MIPMQTYNFGAINQMMDHDALSNDTVELHNLLIKLVVTWHKCIGRPEACGPRPHSHAHGGFDSEVLCYTFIFFHLLYFSAFYLVLSTFFYLMSFFRALSSSIFFPHTHMAGFILLCCWISIFFLSFIIFYLYFFSKIYLVPCTFLYLLSFIFCLLLPFFLSSIFCIFFLPSTFCVKIILGIVNISISKAMVLMLFLSSHR